MRYIQRLSWNNSQINKNNKFKKIVNEEKLDEEFEEDVFWKFKINDVFIVGKLNENSIEILAGETPNIGYGVNFDGEITQILIEINSNIKETIINNIGEVEEIKIISKYKPGDTIDNWENFIEI